MSTLKLLAATAVAVLCLGSAPSASAAPAAKVDVCHQTGSGAVLTLQVSGNALGGHLGHGDTLPAVWYADADADGWGDPATGVESCGFLPGTTTNGGDCDDANSDNYPGNEEVCDGFDNDCDGVVDEGCTGGCTPAQEIAGFADSFDRADGPLGPDWAPPGLPAPDPFIASNTACGTIQSAAIVNACLVEMQSSHVSFDFVANSDEGKEAWAVFAESVSPLSGAYILGCDGGFNPPPGSGTPDLFACGLDIVDFAGAGGTITSPLTVLLTVGAWYHLDATVTAAGALSVTLSDAGGTALGTVTASVPGGVDVEHVGFVVGRDGLSTTCADNFVFSTN